DVRLACTDARGWVLADLLGWHYPRHGREGPGPRRGVEPIDRLDVAELVVLAHGVEVRERVPDAGRLRVLGLARAEDRGAVCAVGFGAGEDVVAPRHVMGVQQIGEICPGVDRLG